MVVRQVGRYLRRVYHDGTNDYFIREGRIVEHIPTIYEYRLRIYDIQSKRRTRQPTYHYLVGTTNRTRHATLRVNTFMGIAQQLIHTHTCQRYAKGQNM